MTTLTNLDLHSILMQHNALHQRLKDGEFDSVGGSYDKVLADEQLWPIINAIGIKGVGDLLHIIHELLVETVKSAHDNAGELTDEEREAHTYVTNRVLQLVDWVELSLFSRVFIGAELPKGLLPMPLDEGQDYDGDPSVGAWDDDENEA